MKKNELSGYCYDVYVNSLIPTTKVKSKFYTCGSGCDLALGALMAGAKAPHAVDIASVIDVYTGGKVVSYNIIEELKHSIIPNYKQLIYKGY